MNSAAQHTLTTLPDLMLAYGHSDEYSFVFSRDTTLFDRRAAKLVTTVVSTFTAAYIALWPRYMIEDGKTSTETDGHDEDTARSTTPAAIPLDLAWLPTFDGRAVCYPSERNLRDYLSWRQVDCTYYFTSLTGKFWTSRVGVTSALFTVEGLCCLIYESRPRTR